MNTVIKTAMLSACLGSLIFPAMAGAATVEELEQRIRALEAQIEINSEETQDVASRLDKGMSVAGYTDVEYMATNKPGDSNGFRMHHMSLMFKKQVSEKLKFFSEIEFEDAPHIKSTSTSTSTVAGKIFLEAVNIDYMLSSSTTLRVGRFFTPAGIWSVDHYPPFVATQIRPQHIRKIFPQLTDGASITGQHVVGNSFVSYDLFVGNGETKAFFGDKDYNNSKAVGLRVNAALPFLDRFEVGVTGYKDKTLVDPTNGIEEEKSAYGVHMQAKHGAFNIRAEYAKGEYEPLPTPSTTYTRTGYYIQPSYDIRQWTLGYRYDYFEPKSTVPDDKTTINTAFVNYHVDQNTVLKWEHHLLNLEDPAKKDYFKSVVSIAVNFD
ncbi:MAG: porin [Gallionella sp.]